MKLLSCPECNDVVRLIPEEWRKCYCGVSGGQYNDDGMTATLGGRARVFGVANPFFHILWQCLNEEGKKKARKLYQYGDQDCWWGEYEGDIQILRVESADGPKVKIKFWPSQESPGQNVIEVLEGAPNEDIDVDDIQDWRTVRQGNSILNINYQFKCVANPSPSFKGKQGNSVMTRERWRELRGELGDYAIDGMSPADGRWDNFNEKLNEIETAIFSEDKK